MHLLGIVMLITTIIFPFTLGEEEDFSFFLTGESIEFTTRTATERMSIIISIDFDGISGRQKVLEIEALLKKWESFPAFSNLSVPSIGPAYYSLTEICVDHLIKIATLIDRVATFKDGTAGNTVTYPCSYTHVVLQMNQMSNQVQNLELAYNRLGKDWTSTTVTATVAQDTALRYFASLLTDTVGDWLEGMTRILSIADTLASNRVHEEIQGAYQEAPCIGQTFEESLEVIDCYKNALGYCCDVEAVIPQVFDIMYKMLPVHYQDIRIRGHTVSQQFARLPTSQEVKILDCNHYKFNSEKIPMCQIIDIEPACNAALLSIDNLKVINNCNFTRSVPQLGIRTLSNGVLVQGSQVQAKVLDTVDYKPLTRVSPILVFSPFKILVEKDREEEIFSSTSNITTTKLVKSRLSEAEIDKLESRYLWLSFTEDFDIEDAVRYILLVLQVILYPIAVTGIAIGIRARRRALQLLSPRNQKNVKNIYKSNRRTLLKAPQ
jgi:hypothetical protein